MEILKKCEWVFFSEHSVDVQNDTSAKSGQRMWTFKTSPKPNTHTNINWNIQSNHEHDRPYVGTKYCSVW